MEYQQVLDWLRQYSQQHILRFWDELSDKQKADFIQQVKSIDFQLLEKLYKKAVTGDSSGKNVDVQPTPVITLKERKKHDLEMSKLGEKLLQEGKIAVFLVAGGQGSRLGFNGPKGVYPISPVKKKSLFQLHAEKIIALNNKYNTSLPWYIMTSKTNNADTIAFFQENNFFGLDKKNVMFFEQELMPAVDKNGRLLLSEKNKIFMSPNGHGGSLKAIWDSGAWHDMVNRGVESIFYFQVDNVLIDIADPAFIGYHKTAHADMSSKVIRKAYPEEKLGIICKINGEIGVIEYSDLSKEDTYATSRDGELKYWAGSIAIHMLETNFIEKINKQGFSLPYHIAEKNIPFIDEYGKMQKPVDKNGFKFETFVFDALHYCENTTTIEVEREKEFSPLKNKTGLDSEETCVKHLSDMYIRWLKSAGKTVTDDVKNVEISALFARTESELIARKDELPEITNNIYIG
jgi:UDP-N-acetylglucosamine/UDP-N-acetylgalactosamine diphosphorylase